MLLGACFSKPGFRDGDAGVGDGDATLTSNVMFVTSASRVPGVLGSPAMAATVTVARDPSHRLAFVSSADAQGDGGRPAMDLLCNDDAHGASLLGTFLAAVPDAGESIADRFASGAPWARVDGVLVLDPAMSALRAPITDARGKLADVDVFGAVASFTTDAATGETCADWGSSSSSLMVRTGFAFRSLTVAALHGGERTCNDTAAHVYCLQE